MDHSDAIQMSAAEQYVLGNLTVSEVEEFERHFFDCPQCSEELRILAVLQDNARAVFLEQGPTPSPIVVAGESAQPRSWWYSLAAAWQRPWVAVPVTAALVIAVFAGYEDGLRHASGMGLPGGSAQEISAYPLYAASRGEETVIAPASGAQFYELYMDRTWDGDFTSYRSVVSDAGNGERWSISLAAPAPGQAIHILTPVKALGAGRYVLVIFGIDREGREKEVARYPFTLRFE
jgi:hypothetical protein